MADLNDPNFEPKAKAIRLAEAWEENLKSPVGPGKMFLYYHALEVFEVLGRKISLQTMLANPQSYIKELREHA